MPCEPGLRPVKADVQAQSVIGGQVERSGARDPRSAIPASTGRRPCWMRGSTTSKVAESQPRTMSRGATFGYASGAFGLSGSTTPPSLGTRSMHTWPHPDPFEIVLTNHL